MPDPRTELRNLIAEKLEDLVGPTASAQSADLVMELFGQVNVAIRDIDVTGLGSVKLRYLRHRYLAVEAFTGVWDVELDRPEVPRG